MARIVRWSGGTIAPDGGPLTTAGWRGIRRWRQEWLALPGQVIPAVVGPDQILRSDAGGLLSGRSRHCCRRGTAPAHRRGTAPDRDRRPLAAAGAA